MGNFDFLTSNAQFATFAETSVSAERVLAVDYALSAIACRKALELAVKWLYAVEGLEQPYSQELNALINDCRFKALLPIGMMPRVDYIRRMGNMAVHTGHAVSRQNAVMSLSNLFLFVDFIACCYSPEYEQRTFDEALLPRDVDAITAEQKRRLEEQAATIEQLQAALNTLPEQPQKVPQEELPPYTVPDISEWETRKQYIDLDLKEAGWVFGQNCMIEVPLTGMPFGTGDGYADYVLYGANGKPLAVVEAKRTSKSALAGQQQAFLYADCLKKMTGQRPVIFYTNGFETYLWDDAAGYPPRRVAGFYSPEDLLWLNDKRRQKATLVQAELKKEITNRYYQKAAIEAICTGYENKHRRALVVMATGTGKTRTAISLVDVFSRHTWARNILFLADRLTLLRQAKKNYKALLPNLSLCNLSEREKEESIEARMVFSTYQTMMNAIDSERKGAARRFTVGYFDLIIVDEAHRSVYNKFAAIFEYFDALMMGLTATPRDEVSKDTYAVFEMESGVPTYAYELDQAISDKFLVPYHTLETTLKFMESGIAYDDLPEEEKQEYEDKFGTDGDALPPWISATALNNWLFNQDTVDRVLLELMQRGLRIEGGDKLGKTIIFAKNHKHAEYIVERFDKLFPEKGSGFARLIDNYINYAEDEIERFKVADGFPQIAVSVDMLDTGVDIPEVLNLVFFKKVFSKTKFMQMIGRGTRLCENLLGAGQDKEYFLCLDYCGNFDYFRQAKKENGELPVYSLSERWFRLRVDIAVELQDLKWGAYGDLRKALINGLVADVGKLKEESFLVRRKLDFVRRYKSEQAWNALTLVQAMEIKDKLGNLIIPTVEDETARQFDVLIGRASLKYLTNVSIQQEQKNLIAIAEALSKLGTVQQVKANASLLQAMQTEPFWASVDYAVLEDIRKHLRGLIQLLKDNGKSRIIFTDFTDALVEQKDGQYEPTGTAFKNYRLKVEKYIRENANHMVIWKLRMNKPLTKEDIGVLEGILWGQVGTKEEYQHEFKDKPLARLVREIAGLDMQAANEAFSTFLSDHSLTPEQIEFIKMIVDFVVKNGILELNQLSKEPFKTIGSIVELFPTDKSRELLTVIKGINQNAGVG